MRELLRRTSILGIVLLIGTACGDDSGSASILVTSPTWTPRILTSARIGSCSPMLDVLSSTSSKSVNLCVKTP